MKCGAARCDKPMDRRRRPVRRPLLQPCRDPPPLLATSRPQPAQCRCREMGKLGPKPAPVVIFWYLFGNDQVLFRYCLDFDGSTCRCSVRIQRTRARARVRVLIQPICRMRAPPPKACRQGELPPPNASPSSATNGDRTIPQTPLERTPDIGRNSPIEGIGGWIEGRHDAGPDISYCRCRFGQ